MTTETPLASLQPLGATIGPVLRHLRERADLSQRAVCAEIFGSEGLQSIWSRWELGTARPNVGSLHAIAHYFGVPLSDFGIETERRSVTDQSVAEALDLLEQAADLQRRAMELLGK